MMPLPSRTSGKTILPDLRRLYSQPVDLNRSHPHDVPASVTAILVFPVPLAAPWSPIVSNTWRAASSGFGRLRQLPQLQQQRVLRFRPLIAAGCIVFAASRSSRRSTAAGTGARSFLPSLSWMCVDRMRGAIRLRKAVSTVFGSYWRARCPGSSPKSRCVISLKMQQPLRELDRAVRGCSRAAHRRPGASRE